MPTTTQIRRFSTQPKSKKKSATKKLSNIRQRFSTFSPRNSKTFLKPDLEKEELSYEKINRNSKFFLFVQGNRSTSHIHHQKSFSDTCVESFDNKFEELGFFNEFEDTIQQYVPIFTRNKN